MTQALDQDTAPAVIEKLFARQEPVALALRQSSAAQRIRKLALLRDALLSRREALLTAFHHDLRKPKVEVDLTELMPVLDDIRHTIKHLKNWMRPQRAMPTLTTLGTRARVSYQPRGRSLIIGPWNYPINTLVGPMVSAVAAGNTVLLKPSEFTPHVNAEVAQLVAEVFDPSEVALVHGALATSQHLLSLPFDHIFFTGSPSVGKIVMGAAAKHLTSVTLELGGQSPVIVDESANLQHAARHLIWGKMVNGGQTCVAPDHVYVHRSVHDRFVTLCREVIAERFGADAAAVAASPDLARMIHPRHAQRLGSLLDDAIHRGAHVATGGEHDAALRYVAPTLLTEVPDDAHISQEEIFGPVLPIAAFDALDAVIARINAGPKPLSLYLWSRNSEVVDKVCRQTSSGSLGINLCVQQASHSNLPFGGVNNSGMGSSHGVFGFKAFSHERAVLHAAPWSALELFFPPYTPGKERLSRSLLKLLQKF
jgi:aldehyde dehydrogenase (NAD+)